MALEVVNSGLVSYVYEDATRWVIDDNEMLHVIGPHGNLASYGRGAWASIHKIADTPKTQEVIVSGIDVRANAEDLIKRANRARKDALAMGGI